MRLLVIGGSGLIGRAVVVKALALGAQVAIAGRRRPPMLPKDVDWITCDVRDSQEVARAVEISKPDAILHLAALLQFECESQPAAAIEINVVGTLNVLEAARRLDIPRVVYGSSIAVYGRSDQRMSESGWSYGTTGIYGVTKLQGEALGSQYAKRFGLTFIALRYSGVIGQPIVDESASAGRGMSLVRKKILETAHGRSVEIEDASGDEMTHLTHTSDAAFATWLALNHPAPGFDVYNVAGPDCNYVSLRDLHGVVRERRPAAGEVKWGRPSRGSGFVDTSRIRADLGFVPKVQLADAIGDCIV